MRRRMDTYCELNSAQPLGIGGEDTLMFALAAH